MKERKITGNLETRVGDRIIFKNINNYTDPFGLSQNYIEYMGNMTSEESNEYYKELRIAIKEIKSDIRNLFQSIAIGALIGTFVTTQNSGMDDRYKVEDYVKPSVTTGLETLKIKENYL